MHKGTYIIIIPVLLIVNNIFQKYYHLNRKLIFIFTLKWKVAFEKMLLYLQWQSMESIQIKTFMKKFLFTYIFEILISENACICYKKYNNGLYEKNNKKKYVYHIYVLDEVM